MCTDTNKYDDPLYNLSLVNIISSIKNTLYCILLKLIHISSKERN